MKSVKFSLLSCLAATAGVLITGSLLRAQTSGPATEYIYLGSRPIAIENSNSGGTGGGGQAQDFAVWPPSASLGAGQSQTFTAVFSGTSGAAVTWSISPAGMGQITGTNGNSAVYTAPASVTSTQAVTITCAATGSPVMSASAEIRFYSPQSLTGDYPLSGSFLNFYRSMPQSLWAREFDWMRQIDMNTIVIGSVGGLRPDSSDPTGFSLSSEGLLYPSTLIDSADRPATDLLEMVLRLADSHNINVYIGSLGTYTDWSDGTEFTALRKYNKLVAQEILSTYGHHSSLKGWYFSQE